MVYFWDLKLCGCRYLRVKCLSENLVEMGGSFWAEGTLSLPALSWEGIRVPNYLPTYMYVSRRRSQSTIQPSVKLFQVL